MNNLLLATSVTVNSSTGTATIDNSSMVGYIILGVLLGLVLLALMVWLIITCCQLADEKGYKKVHGFFLGFFLGAIGLVVLISIRPYYVWYQKTQNNK